MARNICRIEGCEKFVHAFGLCNSHHRKLQLYGDPLICKQVQHHGLTLKERYEMYVKRSGPDDCAVWIGHRDKNGYGRFTIDGRGNLATRVGWMLHYGARPPDDRHICHKCDNPACVNVNHLYAGTQKQNMDDMFKRNGRPNWKPHKGSTHGMAKVTEAIVREIRSTTESGPKFAKRVGISTTQFYDIKNRRSWQHIE